MIEKAKKLLLSSQSTLALNLWKKKSATKLDLISRMATITLARSRIINIVDMASTIQRKMALTEDSGKTAEPMARGLLLIHMATNCMVISLMMYDLAKELTTMSMETDIVGSLRASWNLGSAGTTQKMATFTKGISKTTSHKELADSGTAMGVTIKDIGKMTLSMAVDICIKITK